MAKRANPKLIGGFVIGAIALVMIGVIAFGGSQFLAPKDKAVLFFSGSSLSGLDVGSPVTFRGVKIGSVTGLVIKYDVDKQTLRIPVYIAIEVNKIQVISGKRDIKNLQTLVERGLRAQLVVQSLVTGQANIEFDPYAHVAPEIVDALRAGEKIKAIKIYRQATGAGLRESKEFVEGVQRRSGLG